MTTKIKLNTTNPAHLLFDHPPLQIAVLGGIRLEGLERMRVTLKVQVEHLSRRHNLDLYNDNQTEKLVRKIAERLEVGTSVAAAALSALTDELEGYRLAELEKQQQAQDKPLPFITIFFSDLKKRMKWMVLKKCM